MFPRASNYLLTQSTSWFFAFHLSLPGIFFLLCSQWLYLSQVNKKNLYSYPKRRRLYIWLCKSQARRNTRFSALTVTTSYKETGPSFFNRPQSQCHTAQNKPLFLIYLHCFFSPDFPFFCFLQSQLQSSKMAAFSVQQEMGE